MLTTVAIATGVTGIGYTAYRYLRSSTSVSDSLLNTNEDLASPPTTVDSVPVPIAPVNESDAQPVVEKAVKAKPSLEDTKKTFYAELAQKLAARKSIE